jgi:toxin ParE1/3/4
MKQRLLWTRRALLRTDTIGVHISKSNPAAANRVVERIRVAALSLCDFSSQGRKGRVTGTRELVLADIPYILVYRQTKNMIEILTILHTSRRWPKEF